jgi:hypothetical protein
MDFKNEEAERERLVRYIVAMFDLESGVDISHDLSAMARVRAAAEEAYEHRKKREGYVIDLPNLAPAANFHHALSSGTLASICTLEQPAPDPDAIRAARVEDARLAKERAAEKEPARGDDEGGILPFLISLGVIIALVVSAVFIIHACDDHHPKKDHVDKPDKAERHK